jgi:hypothetical protein
MSHYFKKLVLFEKSYGQKCAKMYFFGAFLAITFFKLNQFYKVMAHIVALKITKILISQLLNLVLYAKS